MRILKLFRVTANCKWVQQFTPKRRHLRTRLHDVISRKNAARISDPTNFCHTSPRNFGTREQTETYMKGVGEGTTTNHEIQQIQLSKPLVLHTVSWFSYREAIALVGKVEVVKDGVRNVCGL